MSKVRFDDDKDSVQLFYKNMYRIIGDLKTDYKDQSKPFKKMFDIEEKIKGELLSTEDGRAVYDKFMNFISHEVGNLLSARVYFRERQEKLSKEIGIAFRDSHPEKLYDLRINFLFAKWALNNLSGNRRKIERLLKQLETVRGKLIEANLPLVVHRAKIYWNKVSGNINAKHKYMDLVQISSECLIQAIDKFEPPYKYIFGVTATYRMTGGMTEETSSTNLKFSPKERRIINRARRAVSKIGAKSDEEIGNYVRESFKGVGTKRVKDLMEASKDAHSYDIPSSEMNGTLIKDTFDSGHENLEESVDRKSKISLLNDKMQNLSILQRKIMKLKVGE